MATEINVIIDPDGVDIGVYSSQADFENSLDIISDMTSGTVVLGHNGITGTMADGDTVTGKISEATGTIALITTTQILIVKTSGTFSSGEQIYKTEDQHYVVSNTAEDAPIVTASCQKTSTDDTNLVDYAAITCDSGHYVRIKAADGHEAQSYWDSDRYAHITTLSSDAIDVEIAYFHYENLQGDLNTTGTWKNYIHTTGNNTIIDSCHFRQSSDADKNTCLIFSSPAGFGGNIVKNVLIHHFTEDGVWVSTGDNTVLIAFSTITNCGNRGIATSIDDVLCKSTICYDNNTDYSGEFYTGSDYNFSKDDSAPGDHSIHGDSDGKYPVFISSTDWDLQITSDCIAVATPIIGIIVDMLDRNRDSTNPDMGAFEYTAVSVAELAEINIEALDATIGHIAELAEIDIEALDASIGITSEVAEINIQALDATIGIVPEIAEINIEALDAAIIPLISPLPPITAQISFETVIRLQEHIISVSDNLQWHI